MSQQNPHQSLSLDGRVHIDQTNGKITINDGTNDRLVASSTVIKLSQEGFDVNTADDDELVWSSGFNMLKIVDSGTVTIPSNTLAAGSTSGNLDADNQATYEHNLGYKPGVMAWGIKDSGSDSHTIFGAAHGHVTDADSFVSWSDENVFVTTDSIVFARSLTNESGVQLTFDALPIKFYLFRETIV